MWVTIPWLGQTVVPLAVATGFIPTACAGFLGIYPLRMGTLLSQMVCPHELQQCYEYIVCSCYWVYVNMNLGIEYKAVICYWILNIKQHQRWKNLKLYKKHGLCIVGDWNCLKVTFFCFVILWPVQCIFRNSQVIFRALGFVSFCLWC